MTIICIMYSQRKHNGYSRKSKRNSNTFHFFFSSNTNLKITIAKNLLFVSTRAQPFTFALVVNLDGKLESQKTTISTFESKWLRWRFSFGIRCLFFRLLKIETGCATIAILHQHPEKRRLKSNSAGANQSKIWFRCVWTLLEKKLIRSSACARSSRLTTDEQSILCQTVATYLCPVWMSSARSSTMDSNLLLPDKRLQLEITFSSTQRKRRKTRVKKGWNHLSTFCS